MPTNPKVKSSPTCKKSKPYEPAKYLGQKVQIDVKYVPTECLSASFKVTKKVERSHREDQKLFYSEMIRLNRLITDENDFKRRLKRHQDKTNNRPMKPLKFMSPKQVLEQYKQKNNNVRIFICLLS